MYETFTLCKAIEKNGQTPVTLPAHYVYQAGERITSVLGGDTKSPAYNKLLKESHIRVGRKMDVPCYSLNDYTGYTDGKRLFNSSKYHITSTEQLTIKQVLESAGSHRLAKQIPIPVQHRPTPGVTEVSTFRGQYLSSNKEKTESIFKIHSTKEDESYVIVWRHNTPEIANALKSHTEYEINTKTFPPSPSSIKSLGTTPPKIIRAGAKKLP